VFLAGAPFQDDDAGVVLELVGLVGKHMAHEAPGGDPVEGGAGGGGEDGPAMRSPMQASRATSTPAVSGAVVRLLPLRR